MKLSTLCNLWGFMAGISVTLSACTGVVPDLNAGVSQAHNLATADETFSQSYAQLYMELPPDQQSQLRFEELIWLNQWSKDCSTIYKTGIFINFACVTQQTEARTLVLKERLNALAPVLSPPQTSSGTSTGYIGPEDIMPGATAYYGLRAYNAGYARPGTNEAVEIRRASDNAITDIVILNNGSLDTKTASSFCASTTCYVVKWYDQTRHGNDITQNNESQQPTLIFNAYNMQPAVQFDYNKQTYLTGSFPWVAGNGPWAGLVTLLTAAPTNWYEPIFVYGTTTTSQSLFSLIHDSSNYQFSTSIYNWNENGAPTISPASVAFYSTGTHAGGYVNGTNWEQPFSASNITGNTFVLGGSPTQVGIWLSGSIGDVVLYPSNLSIAGATNLTANERKYYGF